MKYLLAFGFILVGSMGETKDAARSPSSLKLVQAYLDLAEELALSRVDGKTCETNAYQSEIFKLIQSATSIEGYSPELVKTTTRNELGKMLSFKELIGQFDSSKGESEYRKSLENTEFNSAAAGVYGSSSTLRLFANGKLEAVVLESSDKDDDFKRVKKSGTWNIKFSNESGSQSALARIVFVYPLKNGKMKTYVYRLSFKYDNGRKIWILHNKTKKSSNEVDFTDVKYFNEIIDECSV